MPAFLGRLAATAARSWKRALAIAAVVLVALGALSAALGGTFVDDFDTPGTESQQALDLLQERFPQAAGASATVVFSVEDGTIRDAGRPAVVERTLADIGRQEGVISAISPLSQEAPGQVSRDGRIAFATVQFDRPADEIEIDEAKELDRRGEAGQGAGVEVSMRGEVPDLAAQTSVPIGEIIGLALAILILTVVFRSVAAMAVTIVASLVALVAGLMVLTGVASFTNIPTFAPTLGIMLGLGAGIDYALLIVGRYREQLAAGDDVPRAARIANATAGTSVLAAGAIVVVAIAGLLATGIPFVGQMGVGSAIIVATVAVGAVTLLPTLMGMFAKRLRPKDPSHVAPSARFARWGERVTAHPWRFAALGTAILLLLAAPVTQLRLGQPDDGNDREGSTTRVAYDKLAEGFGPGFNGTFLLAARLPEGGVERSARTLAELHRDLEATPGVAAVTPAQPNERGDAAILTVVPSTSPQDEATSQLVDRLRSSTIPTATAASGVDVYVGGATATLDDLAAKIASRLPIFVAAVIGLSLLLLMAVFRSLWVPLVSALFNLLSIGAAYGVVVAAFQWGWLAPVLGFDDGVPIVSFVPLFMFAVLFGLSMDYNVFLQSRIREEYLRGVGARRSVVLGLSRVARIILAAGAIMTAVFAGFITDPEVVVKTIGLGLASAVLIDVLIVRLIVAPAVMTLLGDRAWTLPGWLDRLLPNIALEGEEEAAHEADADEAPQDLPELEPARA